MMPLLSPRRAVDRPGIRVLRLLLLGVAALAIGPGLRAQGATFRINLTPTPLPTVGVPLDVELVFQTRLPDAASLYVRATGSGDAYAEIPAAQDAVDRSTFTLTVPAAQLDPAGFDFFVEYEEDGEVLTDPEVEPELNPRRLPVLARRIEAPVTLLPRQYAMVTVPVEFLSSQQVVGAINQFASEFISDFALSTAQPGPESVVGDDGAFGPYDPERWRILRWDPRGGAELDGAYRDGPLGVGAFEPGKAVWMVAANGGGFDVESVYPAGFDLSSLQALGSLQPASLPVEVLLQPGWNQVGSPYLFPVAWEDVEGSLLVGAPVAFDGIEYDPEQEVLEPWEGYFVFNPTPAPVPLRFTIPEDAPGPQRTLAARLLDKAGAAAFLLQIRTDEIASGDATPLRTRNTFVGTGQQTNAIKAPASPAEGLHVRLRDADGTALASAITADEAGGTWTLDLRADDAWTQARRFDIRLAEHGRRPAGWSYRLTDADTGEPVALVGGTFTVSIEPGEVRRFHVALGPDAALGTNPLPEAGPLFVYVGPNPAPSGGTVRVTYRTPGGAAELVVLDVLGRPVHAMPADAGPGWHEATWDGTARGAAVAPGLYFLHLRTPAGQAVRTLTVVR